MKIKTRDYSNSLLLGLLITVLALAGCSDGSDGAAGAPGSAGADGQDGQNAVALADIVALNPVLDLSNTVSYDAGTGALGVHFLLTDGNGNGVDATTQAYEFRFYVSELVPAAPQSGEGDAWKQLFNERGTPAAGSPMPGTLTLVDAATGEYNYVMDNTLAASSNVIRVTARARWRETINGTRYVFANPVNASYDFLQADPATELTSSGADTATTAACENCHGARIGDVGHGGGYTEVETCNHCHNADYMSEANGHSPEADLAFMVHRIHAAGDFDAIDHGDPLSFSELTYPQHINTCATCHDGPQADLSYTVPTRANCGSCHSDVDFENGTNHNGISYDNDSACNVCHTAGSVIAGIDLDPAVVHDPDPEPANVPEFDVTIDMTPPANGTHYIAGETPLVSVTLADTATGNPVDAAIYTTAKDGEAAADLTQGLSTANIYVYGPRANAVPVLTVDSTTDPALVGNPDQGRALFVAADPQVETDAGGFKYRLMNNMGDLEPGTYMVRFEGADYGAVASDDYVTASSNHITFQVGTAEEEPKVAGDACTNCHGDTIVHLEGAHPHYAPFDTDTCLGCHDLSGNYAEYIGNRVHAIHSASATGDLHSRDWSEVTYPQDANNCIACHTGDLTPVWENMNEVACGGCHGTDSASEPAAVHMAQMGGTFDPTSLDDTRQCSVCHGVGRSADIFATHHLASFGAEEPEEP